jgi:histone deacetylase 6
MIYRTGYIWDPLMMLHCPEGYVPTDDLISKGSIHPEEPMRIFRIYRKLAEYGLIPRMRKLDYDEVTQEQVLQVHTQELWDKVLGQECTSIVS